MKRIVLAYSGGLETSVAIPWLADGGLDAAATGREVVAVILDLGRRSALVEQRERALSLGAVRCHVVDVREALAGGYILPALQAGVFASARSPMAPAIARPLIAKMLVEIARMESAAAVAYGSGAGSDRPSLDGLIRSLNPALETIVPARVWDMPESAVLAYAREHDIPAIEPGSDREKVSANLWARSVVFDTRRDPWADVPEAMYVLTRSAAECPDRPAYVELEFQSGVPSRVNGIEMPLLEMIESLEIIGGTHGVGRTDVVVHREDGTKCREISEAPAASLLHLAQRELQSLLLDPAVARRMEDTGRAYADLIQSGGWFSPERTTLDAFVSTVQPVLSGSVRLRLFKGDCRVAGRRALALVNS